MAKKKAVKKRGGGRKVQYNNLIATSIVNLLKQGKTNAQVAEVIGVSARCIYLWRQKYPDLVQAMDEAKALIDDTVEASLYKKAVGYSHPETKFFAHEGVVTDMKEVEKHYPPDTSAGIFWLKNRRPKEWRDRVEIDKTETIVNVTIDASQARDIIEQDPFFTARPVKSTGGN